MPAQLSLPVLCAIFVAAAAVVWMAGTHLSDATDVLSRRLGLGQALGGMILLALVTNLPEIAIVASASLRGQMGVAVGNVLGGIAMQTVVLAVLDCFGLGRSNSLTRAADSPQLVMEGALVVLLLALVIVGHHLPAGLMLWRVTPAGLLIVVFWVLGLHVISRMRDSGDGSAAHAAGAEGTPDRVGRAALVFGAGAVATLGAGVLLEVVGERIAAHIGMSGAVFGATALAAATSLPEVSTGLESMRLKDYRMAVSDIFGGNAFLTVLFLMATLLSGQAVLPSAQPTDLYLTALAIVLTTIYLGGLVAPPRRQVMRMGLDSFVVVILYAIGVVGLFFVARHGI
jgi:cation:H+ antiporter